MSERRALALSTIALVAAIGCAETDGDAASAADAEPAAREVVLGPADELDLPPTDLERVTAGDAAPDFTAVALGGDTITLSQYRGDRNVILFFYRGHW